MGVLDSSYIKALGVKSAGLKKIFLIFQDTLRLMSELLTIPLRKVEQIRSANLDKCINERKGSKVEALEEEEVESSVLFSNHFQTIMLPQLSPSLTNTKNTLQPTSSLAYLQPASL